MTEIEYELTYLAKSLPKGLSQCPSKVIADYYLPVDADYPCLRLRQKGEQYEITKKYPVSGRDSSSQYEHTIKLTKLEFDGLTQSPCKKVIKRRYDYELNGKCIEVDVFLEDLDGLVLIDFEFESDEAKNCFNPPDFCLADVTQEKVFAGGLLAGRSFLDIGECLAEYKYKAIDIKSLRN